VPDVSPDVIVIGAGAAGLSAARELSTAGKRVVLLEGRDRVGGRICTHQMPGYPVELGAEFVHGSPPEICEIAKQARLTLAELEWRVLRSENRRWIDAGATWSGMDRLFSKMSADRPRLAPRTRKEDQSFQEFLDHTQADAEVRQQALGFVEGFHAADPSRISVHSLVKSNAADEENGESQFRFVHGYEALIKSISERIDWDLCELRLNAEVTEVEWKAGETLARTVSGSQWRAPQMLITVPLGVLKSDGLAFHPPLKQKEKALQGLEMGPVVRASLCFRNQFWRTQPRFRDAGFIFTDDPWFPTWWTSNPLPFPILTGWAPGHYARNLGTLNSEEVIERALESLASILEMDRERLKGELAAGFTHDWQHDRFSHGAYSYALVGGSEAGRELAVPVAQTLFFAGEATDSDGHNGTVHGAIRSGVRAAKAILTTDKH
jgi:monoamine oxidase